MIDDYRYDYLRRKRYVVYQDDHSIRPETLAEMRKCEVIEFYSRERVRELSEKHLIHNELRQRIEELLRLRCEHPEGSNPECMCMDMITELISKLDLEDFRTLKIERIIEDGGYDSVEAPPAD